MEISGLGAKAIAGLRVFLGASLLYAGWEKISAAKPFDATGFLTHATGGAVPNMADPKAIVNPTHDLWIALAGNAQLMPVVNFLVVAGELAIGAALILGLATRFSAIAGTLLMVFITVAAWSFANGPFNETVMYGAITLFLAVVGAGRWYGLDAVLESRYAARLGNLRYALS